MSDEEDYMSDAFLAKLAANDVRPSLIKNQTVKRKNEIESQRKQVNEKKHKSVHEIQKDNLKEGLNKALAEDNKGFRMLQKMGFQSGSSLGKSSSSSAIKEPIKLNFDNAGVRSGLGTATETRERTNRAMDKLKQKINASNLSADEFRQQLREQNESKQVSWDLHKLQKTCRIIDLEHHIKFPIHPWFWPEDRSQKNDDEQPDEKDDKNTLSVSFLL